MTVESLRMHDDDLKMLAYILRLVCVMSRRASLRIIVFEGNSDLFPCIKQLISLLSLIKS